MRFSFPQPLRPLFLLTLLLLTAAQPLCAQAPAWQDATSPGSGYGSSTAVDAAGNTYVTGSFDGTATFGATTLTSAGGSDIFVAKRTPTGAWQWAARAGGSEGDFGSSVTVDGSGSVVVTGGFDSPNITFGTTTLTNNSGFSRDLFVAKLTPTGAWQWATRAGGSEFDESVGVAVDGNGGVVVTGNFISPTIAFGTITLTNANAGVSDLFVAKLTPMGVWQWATRSGCSVSGLSVGVAVDGSGGVVVTGGFASPTITFGTITLTNANAGVSDIFVAKLTPMGAWQWATRAGGIESERSVGVAVDGTGSVVVTGSFGLAITFGAITLTSAGEGDIFVAKLTPTGAWQWATSTGGSGDDGGFGVAVDGSGSVVVTGDFSSPTIPFGTTTLTSAGDYDLFVAKLTPTGAWQWATGAGGSNADFGLSVALNGSGSVVIAGAFNSPTIRFGATTLTNPTSGSEAIFLARLSSVTGLPDEANAPGLSLWPNPAHGTVRLSSAAPGPVQLLDAVGRVVRTSHVAPGTSNLDLSGLPPGLYTVRAGTQARRLVVE